jgi:hypothetical protein
MNNFVAALDLVEEPGVPPRNDGDEERSVWLAKLLASLCVI